MSKPQSPPKYNVYDNYNHSSVKYNPQTNSEQFTDSSTFNSDAFAYDDYMRNIHTDPYREQKLNKLLRHYEKHINIQCNTEQIYRDQKWYKISYKILMHLNHLYELYASHHDLIFPGISYLANCMINKKSSIMDKDDVLLALNECDIDKYRTIFKQNSKLNTNEIAQNFQILLYIQAKL